MEKKQNAIRKENGVNGVMSNGWWEELILAPLNTRKKDGFGLIFLLGGAHSVAESSLSPP